MCVEVIIHDYLHVLSLSLGELEMEWYDRYCWGDELEDERGDHVSKGEDAEDEEVWGKKHVDVFFTEDLNHLIIQLLSYNWQLSFA